ncbi:Uncharacterised protein [Salmonella enterica subsp. enterica serovar Bovismorbificans]|uniref:Uncharacterized protein n=1 Tax=Salmonella enterica subsp. enterica serovar Bovismorbificans TaxID=58097 RepID=A0A655BN35_SALET|nr:Uncharacterised protein [Salmonella enterica subsp. enterica serovar Bovismorbificans]
MKTNILAIFFQRLRRDHRRRRVRQNINESGERLFQGNFYRCRIDNLRFCDIFIQVITLEVVIRIAGAIEIRFHRRRIKIRAVLKFHPLS